MTTTPAAATVTHSFDALEGCNARVLILGTMPGQASLQAQQYYHHRRNAFWPIMMSLTTDTPASFDVFEKYSYVQRCNTITHSGVAVWDVLAACERPGSLDSNIVRRSEQANPIEALLQRQTELTAIVFNGKTAATLYKRHIADRPELATRTLDYYSLPSTSPAMASLTLKQKHDQWQAALAAYLTTS